MKKRGNSLKTVLIIFVVALFGITVGAEAALGPNNNSSGISQDEEPAPDSRVINIVGGEDAEPGEFPYQVMLLREVTGGFVFFCGGSILNESWILTASHCLFDTTGAQISASTTFVLAGELTRGVAEGTEQLVDAARVIPHPNYVAGTFENDIALIELNTPLQLTPNQVEAVQLNQDKIIPAGMESTVSGWGTTQYLGDPATVLQHVSVPVVSNSTCATQYQAKETTISGNMLCAGEATGGEDACQGDSGGPLVTDDGSGAWKQIGVVSFGEECALANFAGVYARVSNYISWVQGFTTDIQVADLASPNLSDLFMPFIYNPIPPPSVDPVQFAYSSTECREATSPFLTSPAAIPGNVTYLLGATTIENANGMTASSRWLINGVHEPLLDDTKTVTSDSFPYGIGIFLQFCSALPAATYTYIVSLDGVEQSRGTAVVGGGREAGDEIDRSQLRSVNE